MNEIEQTDELVTSREGMSEGDKLEQKTLQEQEEAVVYLQREDILRLLLIGEKRRRIAAEKKAVTTEENLLNTENTLLISNLDKKYGISLNDYSIDTETGKAIKR